MRGSRHLAELGLPGLTLALNEKHPLLASVWGTPSTHHTHSALRTTKHKQKCHWIVTHERGARTRAWRRGPDTFRHSGVGGGRAQHCSGSRDRGPLVRAPTTLKGTTETSSVLTRREERTKKGSFLFSLAGEELTLNICGCFPESVWRRRRRRRRNREGGLSGWMTGASRPAGGTEGMTPSLATNHTRRHLLPHTETEDKQEKTCDLGRLSNKSNIESHDEQLEEESGFRISLTDVTISY